jgi:hypothetical protein
MDGAQLAFPPPPQKTARLRRRRGDCPQSFAPAAGGAAGCVRPSAFAKAAADRSSRPQAGTFAMAPGVPRSKGQIVGLSQDARHPQDEGLGWGLACGFACTGGPLHQQKLRLNKGSLKFLRPLPQEWGEATPAVFASFCKVGDGCEGAGLCLSPFLWERTRILEVALAKP